MKTRSVPNKLVKGCLFLIPLLPFTLGAQIDTDNDWLGGDGDWSDPSKWSAGAVPSDDNYRAQFRIADNVADITVDGNYLFRRWYVQNNQTVNMFMEPGSSLQTDTGFQAFQGGTLNVYGPETGLAVITNRTVNATTQAVTIGSITTGHNTNPSFVTYSGPNLEIIAGLSLGRSGSNSTVRFENGVTVTNGGSFAIGATVNDNTGLALNNHVTFSGVGTVMNSVSDVNLAINVASRPKYTGSNTSGTQSTSYQQYNSLTVEDGAQILIDNSRQTINFVEVGSGGTYKRHNWIEITGAGSLIEYKGALVTIEEQQVVLSETRIGRSGSSVNYDNYMIVSDGGTYKTNSTTYIWNARADTTAIEEKNRLVIANGGNYITSNTINVIGGMIQLADGGSLIGEDFDDQVAAIDVNVSGSGSSSGRFEAAGSGLGASVTVNMDAGSVFSVGLTGAAGESVFNLGNTVNMNADTTLALTIFGNNGMDSIHFNGGTFNVAFESVDLEILLGGGYEPAFGDTFQAFTGAVVLANEFDSILLPELDGSLAWDLSGFNSGGDWTLTVVPEPSTYALIFGLGVLGLAGFRRFRR